MHLLFALLCAPLLASFQPTSTRIQQELQSGSRNTTNSRGDAYLFSLQWPSESSFSKPVKEVWRWKDSVLGDGRDFFVPKPKTLTALNEYLLENCPTMQECSVLSNCARFEIIVWTKEDADAVSDLSEQISQCLVAQVASYQNRPFRALQDQLTRFDSPQWIDQSKAATTTTTTSEDVARHLPPVASGVAAVAHYLSLVAAGMATRPNRPDRPVPFRPFSSRDAHILLQLKRTPTTTSSSTSERSNYLSLLLNAALSAGKAARDEHKVPQLTALRPYGSGDGKYSMEPPPDVQEAAVQAALQDALHPAVQACVDKVYAMSCSNDIARLRRESEELAQNQEELKWLRQELHEPTMQLRRGSGDGTTTTIDMDALVQKWKGQLEEQRRGRL